MGDSAIAGGPHGSRLVKRLTAYWYRGEGGLNLGDALVPLLFRRLASVTLDWAPPADAELVAIGSNVELLPDGYRGIVWGAGIMRAATRRDLTGADVVAVRGNLTASVCGVQGAYLADPGLLAPDLLEARPEVTIPHGYVRHFADSRRVAGHSIDILAGPEHVIREVARCRRITSSSLHGIVLADALGIPSRWSPHRAAPAVKFEDYVSAFGQPILPYVWRQADPAAVTDRVGVLREQLAAIAERAR